MWNLVYRTVEDFQKNGGNAHFWGGIDSRSVTMNSYMVLVKSVQYACDQSLKNTLWLHYRFDSSMV
jgi:hypothetical protein